MENLFSKCWVADLILVRFMLLVLDRDAELHLFRSADHAQRQLETIDIENAEYEFCDIAGQRFVPQITSPVGTFRSGTFQLRPDGIADQSIPLSFVARAKTLGTPCGEITSLDILRERVARREI
ncbi:MAG TPA: hypothetical protein VJT71_06605 [Pyrinomonadaceae bacterium]|nr:hypothetical protein [Pyrinomonadaceae bacterium]